MYILIQPQVMQDEGWSEDEYEQYVETLLAHARWDGPTPYATLHDILYGDG